MISVVIPAFNEAECIVGAVGEVRRTLEGAGLVPYEVIVVDDGSDDGTGRLAEEAGARLVRHPHNIGYGGALKSGITRASYDTIVIVDSDGTYPINRIPDLVRRYREGYDMVVGARRGAHYRGSAIKWPMRLFLRFLVEWTSGREIPDINSGLRVFSRETIMNYFRHLCDTFSFTTSATLAYMMTSRFVGYVPIDYVERIGTTHVRLWRDSFRTLQFISQAIVYYNPMKIFLLMSILCLALAAISVFAGIVFHIATGFVMGVAAILAAILVFALGLLADLLRQIMAARSE